MMLGRKSGVRGMRAPKRGPRFSGRTPSLQVEGFGGKVSRPPRGFEARNTRARQVAWTIVGVCGILSLLFALMRSTIGALPETLTATVVPSASGFVPRVKLVSLPSNFGATLFALPKYLAGVAAEVGPEKLWLPWFSTLLAFSAWHILARFGGWKRPGVGVAALLGLQLWGAACWLGLSATPPRRVQSDALPWAFGSRTRRSGALISPERQLERLQARGFRGACFGDSAPLESNQRKDLQAQFANVLLVNGAGSSVPFTGWKFLVVGARRPFEDIAGALENAKRAREITFQGGRATPFDTTESKYSTDGALLDDVSSAQNWRKSGRGLVIADASQPGEPRRWTLLPRSSRDVGGAFSALKKGQSATAFAPDTNAVANAWRDLSRAQKWNIAWQIIALLALAWLWGSMRASDGQAPLGPSRALSFLRRRRLPPRLVGASFMMLAFALSAWAWLGACGSILARVSLTPSLVLLVWLLCDLLFWVGRGVWKRKS